ncbi:phosphotransferase family protein [Chitinivorax sp. B]|uniref:phosphotransferase family protein n=1 Tax=Chitinivorax sp. B TaxID=2502235 RepID=UPI0010F4B790|nr:phosphotransferase family protein [Chitinivorax sp. B]
MAAVDTFIKRQVPGLNGFPEISQFPGGASNLTYLVSYTQRDLILRRPPFGHRAKSAHDMAREARIMTALKPVYRYVPTVIAQCDDPSVMGCDFYVMDRITGIIPRQNLPIGLSLNEADTRKLCLNVIDKMIELHQVNCQVVGLATLGKGEGYVARQIAGWSDRFIQAHTDDVGRFEEVMAWLAVKQPAQDVATCVIHNDYRFDNVVLNPSNPFEVIGVLDWEMATLGDPLMDLGNTLAYWVQVDDDAVFQQMRRQPTNVAGMLTRREVIEYYGNRTGFTVANFDFYSVYGLFRLAAIIQQIYRRFKEGQARNPQFAYFGAMANYLEQRCQRLIQQSIL